MTGIATAIAAAATWTVWGGPGAIGQVLTFRGSRGWEFESVGASLLRIFSRHPLRFEAGAWRVGAPSPVVTVLGGLVVLVVVAIAWRRMAAGVPPRPGVGETVIVAALVVASTLLSPQFTVWLLPWVAIAAAAGITSLERWAGVVVGLTVLTWLSFEGSHPELGRTELALLGRNAALIGLLVAGLLALRAPKVETALTADVGAV